MFDRAQIDTLAAILRTGSFDGAASALGLTQSAVSQRIRALEEAAGTVLIRRGPPATATAEGQRLARHAEELRLIDLDLARDLGRSPKVGETAMVRVAVNADSLATWVLPALARVEGVLFDIVVDDESVSADLLRRGEVSAAVSTPGPAIAGCESVALGSLPYRATAAPDFARRWFPDGATAQALAVAPVLTFSVNDKHQANWIAARTGRTLHPPSHYLSSTQGFLKATELGLGWCLNPASLCDPLIAAGQLVDLDPGRPFLQPLVWQVSRRIKTHLLPLTRAIRSEAARALIP